MAKQLNVNLAFTADTSQAKAQLQSLQTSLTQLISSAQLQDQGLGISKELQHSITLSSQLKSLLTNATNIETGKLDLGKFNEGLQKSGTSLQTYSNALNSLGVQGQQAFSQLASSILQAELPLKRSNALLGQFMTTLKNTAKWQISSSLLHGFIGTVQSAYGYAQDLNESLNNIRIVTGQNIDQMAKFAEKANQAAKALSTSTTEYTNASLIYYQQGLSASEVQERTEVTIKMANVSRQSAEIVSDQMTAVWNNFYDGGKSLEYYADVMTALGAATASSSDEIAGGLEKFAAIGETIGLSYEYAASALATITANTRQSEEVVGTALKTIFARIQGLKLGETLEDGVELNKYSEALQAVGISIFEQNGELKKMDNILNEMGAKWDTLSKAQQTALAQTVAGVRQYNQLISLMDNWDDMQKNLDISYNSEGALQEQTDTYAESWEAASKRVKASAEGIYQTLLNDKFFIGVNKVFAELLQLIDNTIDAFGGLPGVLFMLGSVITSVFGTQITQSFDNFIYRIKMSTEVGKQSILQLRQQASDLLITNNVDMASTSGNAAANAYKQQGIVQNELIAKAEQLSEIERQQAQYLLDGHSSLVQQTVDLGILVEQEERRAIQIERSVMASARSAASQRFQGQADEINRVNQAAIDAKNQLKNLEEAYYQLSTIPTFENIEQIDTNSMQRLLNIIKELEQSYGDLNLIIDADNKKITSTTNIWGNKLGTGTAGVFRELKNSIKDGSLTAEKFSLIMDKLATSSHTKIRRLAQVFVECGMSEEEATREAQRLAAQYDNLGDRTAELTESQIRLNNATNNFQNFLQKTKGAVQTFGSAVTVGINALSSFGMMMMSIKGIVDTLNNTEMSFGDKFITIFTQMTFLLPSVLHTVTQLTTLFGPQGFIGSMTLANSVLGQYGTQLGASINSINLMILAKKAEKGAIDEATTARLLEKIMIKTGCNEKKAEQILEAMLTKGKHLLNAATAKEIALEIAKKAIKAATNPILLATVAITAALTAAVWAFVYASQAEERALQAAKESVDNTARAYEDAENAVTKFKETASNYTEAIKGMKDLAYGTAEYAEKLREANDAAIELIKNNPDLKYDVQGGLIQFEGGMDALEAMEKQLMNQTYNAKMFAVNSELKYNDLSSNNTIREELKSNTDISIGMETSQLDKVTTQFIKDLSKMQYAEQVGSLQNKEAIKSMVQEASRNAGVLLAEFNQNRMVDEIYQEVQNGNTDALLDLAKEVSQNTMALQAETAALLQEEYGQKNVNKYGEAEIYAAKSSILEKRASQSWTDEHGKDTGFAQYLSEELDTGFIQRNNISELSKENQELLAKIMGKSVEDIINGEIRISDSEVKVSTAKDASNNMLPTMSVEDFNRAALNFSGQGQVSWDEISAKLDTTEGRQKMQQYAKDSGLYSEDDIRILDPNSGFNELTYGTAKALETKFSENAQFNAVLNTQTNYNSATDGMQAAAEFQRAEEIRANSGNWNESVQEYLKGVDTAIKENVANRLLELDTDSIDFGDMGSTLKEIETQEAAKYREQEAKTELQTESKNYGLDYEMTEKQMGRVKETLQDYNKELEKNGKLGEKVEKEGNQLTKGYGNLEKSSKDLTVANQRMNRGIATLGDNFKDWSKVLKTGDKTTLEYTEAMEGMKDAFADIYNVSDSSLISDDFLENMDPAVMKQIADGNIDAIESMRMAMADDIVANIIVNNGLTGAEGETVTSLWQQAKAELDAMGDLTVGTHIEGTSDFVTKLNEMIAAAGMTKEQVTSMLGSMGMSATLHTKHEEQDMTVPTYTEHYEETNYNPPEKDEQGNIVRPASWSARKYTVPGEPITVKGFAEVVSIETESGDTSSGGGIDVIGSGKPSPSSVGRASNGGGGGGGRGGGGGGGKKNNKPKKVEPTEKKKKKDEVERYHEINEELEDLQNNLDEIANKKDEVWGKDKLALMDQEKAKLKELSKSHGEYQKQIAKNLNDDRWEAETRFGAKIDNKTGRITNYEELQEQWMNEWNTKAAEFDAREQELENQLTAAENAENEAEKENVQEKLDTLSKEREEYDKLYEEKREALEQYEETLNLSEEAKAQAEEYLREIQALNLEKLEYEIEIRVEVNERDIAYLEQRLERISSNSSANISKRISNLEFFANEYKTQAYGYREDIQEALRLVNAENPDDRITKDAAKKRRNESVDSLFDVENSLIEGFEQITSELEEAMEIEEEKLGRYYDKTEGFLALMEHYKEIVSLTEGEKSYENMNKLLRNSQKILKDRIKIDEKEVEIWSSARQDLEKRINSGEFKNNERGLAEAEATLNSLIEKEEEAKGKVREDIAELGAYATEIFENSIELATKNFEERMFGGPLSDILNSIEMMNARQEELLTTTNKIYETNKMLRNIEKDIEATTNLRAKQAYNEFQNKVKQKQEQSELTQFELDLLTAEYEITKAQIELEEAQNAKNQVRLVRNSEGNYGYVYTSDTKKVADAEQKLEDAKNKYYNTALDGSKNYQEQIYKHIEEWEEKVKEVYQDQTISEEERQKKLKEINDTYDTLIKQDKQLFYIAKAAMEESSYTHQADYDLKGIESAENWSIESQKYIGELQGAQNEYKTNTNEVATKTTENFGNMETAISDTSTQSDILKTKTENLAESMETNLLNSVENATKAWKEYYKVLKEVSAITETEARANIQDTKLNTSNNFAQDIIDEYKLYGIEGADQDYIGGLISQRVQKLKDIYGGYYIDIAQDFEKEIEKALKRGDKETAQAYNDLLWQKNQILKSTDYSKLLEEYLKTEGSSIDDNIAKGLLKMREQKIELLGLTNVKTNQQIINEYSRTYPTKPVESQQQYKENEKTIQKEEETITPTQKDSPKVGDYVEVKSNTRWYANAWGSGKSGNARAGKIKYIYTTNGATHSYNIDGNGWVKLTDLVGYDTGGYTGAWGPEGKMAMLHEKELVLNKQDTENFLTATEILREISKVLDNNALIASLGMINLKAMSIGTPADQVLQQEVTIHADFPNVTDHNEIELAIDNLINAASQHAYRV